VCGSTSSCRTSCTTDVDCAPPSVCGNGSCGGLTGEYFRRIDFTALAFTRTDPAIDFDWGAGPPSPLLDVHAFSARWRGRLTPRFSERYTFHATAADGARLTIAGVVLIDHLGRHSAAVEDSGGPIDLVASQPVDILLEYLESGGQASVSLSWSSNSEPEAVVPTSALAPE
jgi:hypothetical protein